MDNLITPDDIERYLNVPYVDCGRDLSGWDCWGLVKFVLNRHFSIHDIDSFNTVNPDDKQNLTKAFLKQRRIFSPSESLVGSVAAGFKGSLLLHVGVVINDGHELKVLHASRAAGTSKINIRRFGHLFSKVLFYAHNSRIS